MKKEFLNLISNAIGLEPLLINSKLLVPQSRPRFYWANWGFKSPLCNGSIIADILEPIVDTKYYLSERFLKGFANSNSVFKDRFKPHNIETINAHCLTARYYKMGKTDPYFKYPNGDIRRFTPRECGRMQGVPDKILNKILSANISDTQLYKMFGNGWTIDVIAHIFSSMDLPIQVVARQLELFE